MKYVFGLNLSYMIQCNNRLMTGELHNFLRSQTCWNQLGPLKKTSYVPKRSNQL